MCAGYIYWNIYDLINSPRDLTNICPLIGNNVNIV